jgi:hypothetical protein
MYISNFSSFISFFMDIYFAMLFNRDFLEGELFNIWFLGFIIFVWLVKLNLHDLPLLNIFLKGLTFIFLK